MSILSGFLKTIKYRFTDEGYKWQSEKTSSQTVVMGDGTDDTDTVEKRFGKMKGITSSLASTSEEYALSAKAGKSLQDSITGLNTSLSDVSTNLKSSAARPTLVDTEKFMFLGTPIIIKNNNIGTLQACVKMNAVYTSGNAVLQLPTGYRGGISNVACLVSGENSGVTGVTADENGKIKFTSNISANTWVYINITYQITT